MIQAFAKYGNHYTTEEPFSSDASVKRAFERNGFHYDHLVEECRDPAHSVPFFENLIGSTWHVTPGATVSRVDMATGHESDKTVGPGQFAPDGYWATYETAHEALDRSAAKVSYSEFLSAVVQGIASIEGFLNSRAEAWNLRHPEAILVDSRENRVSFDNKIDQWLPTISGHRLDKSDHTWQHFRRLRALRDDAAVHPKSSGRSIRYEDLVELINIFRTGIAGMLLELHRLCGAKVPRVIIRDRFAPDAILSG